MNKIRFIQAMSSGWNRKERYMLEKDIMTRHKVYELLDQNNNTPFYLHHNQERQIVDRKDNLLRST